MGGSLSKQNSLTGLELKEQTKEIRSMSDALFQFMYAQWEIKEVFQMADNPEDYVIAISDLITKHFRVLGYRSKSNKIGEIYFRKWDDLEPPRTKEKIQSMTITNDTRRKKLERNEPGAAAHKQNAEIVAFYFVRIFQILGAMLLVVKDTNFPEFDENGNPVGTISENAKRNYAQSGYNLPPISRFRPLTPTNGSIQKGGKIPDSTPLGPYDFLRYYLIPLDSTMIQTYADKFKVSIRPESDKVQLYRFDASSSIFFEYTPPINTPSRVNEPSLMKQRIGVLVKTRTSSTPQLVYIGIQILNHVDQESVDGYLAPGAIKNKDNDTEVRKRYPASVTFTFKKQGSEAIKKWETTVYRNSDSSTKPTSGMPYKFTSNFMLDVLKARGWDPLKDFVKYLDNIVSVAVIEANPGNDYIMFKGEEKKKETTSTDIQMKKLKDPVDNKSLSDVYKLIGPSENPETKEMEANRNQPHCVARALQLLDAASINGKPVKGQGRNRICSSSNKGTSTQIKSVVRLFGKVSPVDYKDSEKILKAFVGKESSGEPLGTSDINKRREKDPTTGDDIRSIINQNEKLELEEAIKKLAKAFVAEQALEKVTGFSDIKVDTTPNECKGNTEPRTIQSGGPEFNDLQRHARELLAHHVNSVIEIGKFLKSIFNISQRPDGSWKVEGPKTEILFAGFVVLDQLTDQARNLLINYYSGCEERYQKGVKAWAGSQVVASDSSKPVAQNVKENNPVAPVVPKNTSVTRDPSGP